LGYKYWGGLYGDIEANLNNAGFKTYTVATGPLSSNWDRVCEGFAQIKGGTTDYGLAHSTKYKHERYARTYEGLFPEWGSVNNKTGEINKIHIISHSMGGQDARLLSHLLINGNVDEKNATGRNVSTLFQGNNTWIHSITTISTPHDGTDLATIVSEFIPFVVDVVAAFAVLAGAGGDTLAHIYDLKLDQFGMVQKEGESLIEYLTRATGSAIFESGFEDISVYDLSVDGAQKHNKEWKCEKDIFYFSYTTEATYQVPILGTYLPDAWMFAVFWPFAIFMGGYQQAAPTKIDNHWFQSDGVVNLISQAGPTINTNCVINSVNVAADQDVIPGVFNHIGTQNGWDHATVIGSGLHNVQSFYQSHALFLNTLPSSSALLSSSSFNISYPHHYTYNETFTMNSKMLFNQCLQAKNSYDNMCIKKYGKMYTNQLCSKIKENVQLVCQESDLVKPNQHPATSATSATSDKNHNNNNNNNHHVVTATA